MSILGDVTNHVEEITICPKNIAPIGMSADVVMPYEFCYLMFFIDIFKNDKK